MRQLNLTGFGNLSGLMRQLNLTGFGNLSGLMRQLNLTGFGNLSGLMRHCGSYFVHVPNKAKALDSNSKFKIGFFGK
jgi:hypothetical protein